MDAEEENNLDNEFKEYINDNSDSFELLNNEDANEKEEMNDILEDFLDIPSIKDNDLLKKRNNVKEVEENNTLNNPTNPFIKEMIESNIDDKSHNKIKEKNKNEEEIEISNKEKEGEEIIQKLKKNFIIEINLIGDKKDNFYYQNIKYANKKFNASYTKKEGLKHDIIYYYCKYHRTI